MESPRGRSIARCAATELSISLEGHGGDELLGGYGMHLLLALLRGPTVISAPMRTLDLIGTLQRMYGENSPERPGGTAKLALLTFPWIRAAARKLLPGQRTLQETSAAALERHRRQMSTADWGR